MFGYWDALSSLQTINIRMRWGILTNVFSFSIWNHIEFELILIVSSLSCFYRSIESSLFVLYAKEKKPKTKKA